MKITTFISLGLFIAWVALAIIDIWFDIVSWDVFVKITLTIVLLGILALALRVLCRSLK